MSKRLIIILLVMLCSRFAGAQSANNFDKIWVQGGPTAYTTTFNGSTTTCGYIDSSKRLYLADGNANICDSFGNLVMVTNGYTLFDKHLDIMDGGDTLVPSQLFIEQDGWSILSQSSIILPFDNGKYYLITPAATDSLVVNGWQNTANPFAIFNELLYDVIDMKANTGAGKVTRKMISLLQNTNLSLTQMMACKHADGKDWWLLKQAFGSNTVYKFLFRQDTVLGPFIQTFSAPQFDRYVISGQSVFSRDGTKYATTCRGAQQVFIADFDRCSGMLSNPKVYHVPMNQPYSPNPSIIDSATNGLAFSPDGRFIYVNGWSYVQQMDLQAGNPDTTWVNVAGADTTAQFQLYSNLYLGPDDKLYIGNWNGFSQEMSVINNPNNKGTSCNFCPKCLRFPIYNYPTGGYAGIETPPCMPNYHLGPSNPICWVTGVEQLQPETLTCKVYPNPAQNNLTVSYSKAGTLELTDITGKQVERIALPENTTERTIDISTLPSALYLYRYIVNGKVQLTGKLAIIH